MQLDASVLDDRPDRSGAVFFFFFRTPIADCNWSRYKTDRPGRRHGTRRRQCGATLHARKFAARGMAAGESRVQSLLLRFGLDRWPLTRPPLWAVTFNCVGSFFFFFFFFFILFFFFLFSFFYWSDRGLRALRVGKRLRPPTDALFRQHFCSRRSPPVDFFCDSLKMRCRQPSIVKTPPLSFTLIRRQSASNHIAGSDAFSIYEQGFLHFNFALTANMDHGIQ